MKHILYIPIISSRSHKTNVFDLCTDGNFKQFLSIISKSKETCKSGEAMHVKCYLPELRQMTSDSESYLNMNIDELKNENIYLEPYHIEFPHNAYEQRHSLKFFPYIKKDLKSDPYDELIVTPTYLMWSLLNEKLNFIGTEFISYIPVSGTAWLENDDEVFQVIAERSDKVIVGSESQLQSFPKAEVLNNFISNFSYIRKEYKYTEIYDNCPEAIRSKIDKLSETKYIYFPFRISDPGYKASNIFSWLANLYPNTKIVYTDPNHSIDEMGDGVATMISNGQLVWSKTDRCEHLYHLAFGNCIVPYFEDDSVHHAIFDELKILKTKVARNFDQLESQLKTKRPKLIVLEGFDEIGKGTQLELLTKNFKYGVNGMNCRQIKNVLFDTSDKTKFKDKQSQMNTIANTWADVLRGSDVVSMCAERFWWSDDVYSMIFNREPQFTKVKKAIENRYDVQHICMLWNSYSDFVRRCEDIGKQPEYSLIEFLDIQALYKKMTPSNGIAIPIKWTDSIDNIYNIIEKNIK